MVNADGLLGPADIRQLATRFDIRPTKTLGQNFLHDANTIRRIVRLAQIKPGQQVLEVGPGLGSLTLGLLAAGANVTALEIDSKLATALPDIVTSQAPQQAAALRVVNVDALRLNHLPDPQPTALVANLPYNVGVPILLHLVELLDSLQNGLVMVQAEVADRLTAGPGSKVYGIPSAKLAWYATTRRAGPVPRTVFWPVPNVDSGLVAFTRRPAPVIDGHTPDRSTVFSLIDAAFSQRRKTIRAALASWAGSADRAEHLLRQADIDPRARGEQLDITAFATLALVAQEQR